MSTLVNEIVTRLNREPHLDDFLGWWGGTLEYWIEIVTAGVGKRFGWTAHSEVPYVTGSPAASSKTNIKWADGIVIADDGWSVLLEIKTIPMKSKLGGAIEQVPKDFAALVSIDWAATTRYRPAGVDNYTDPEWWTQRERVQELWGLALALIHGAAPLADVDELLKIGLTRGLRSVERRFRDSPGWLDLLQTSMGPPAYRHELTGQSSAGLLLGWSAPLSLTNPS